MLRSQNLKVYLVLSLAVMQVLSDEGKRAEYDKYGSASQQPGFDPNAFAGFGAGGFNFRDFGSAFRAGPAGADANIFEQLFGTSFGGGGRGRGRSANINFRGEDLEARIGISFIDAAKGVKYSVNITPIVDCKSCHGGGLKPGVNKVECHSCGGTGQRTFVVEAGFHMAATCNDCMGTGEKTPRGGECGDCRGAGKIRVKKAVPITIPAGMF